MEIGAQPVRIARSAPDLPAVQRGQPMFVTVDGRPTRAYDGETVAAVLLAEGIRAFRHTAVRGEPRGLFCGMGICYECLVTVDGQPDVRACVTPVRPGMVIETHPPGPLTVGEQAAGHGTD